MLEGVNGQILLPQEPNLSSMQHQALLEIAEAIAVQP
jgi:hypothetical protein